MKTYFEAWNERMEWVAFQLLQRAKQLSAEGFSVLRPRSRPTFIVVIDHENRTQVTLTFREVPYRWEFSVDHKPNTKTGSSHSVGSDSDYNVCPSVEQIKNSMKPIWCDPVKYESNKLRYLICWQPEEQS